MVALVALFESEDLISDGSVPEPDKRDLLNKRKEWTDPKDNETHSKMWSI